MSEIVNSILSGRSSPLSDTSRKLTNQDHVRSKPPGSEEAPSKKMLNNFHQLNSALASDQPLKDNVPRGYYLNILV